MAKACEIKKVTRRLSTSLRENAMLLNTIDTLTQEVEELRSRPDSTVQLSLKQKEIDTLRSEKGMLTRALLWSEEENGALKVEVHRTKELHKKLVQQLTRAHQEAGNSETPYKHLKEEADLAKKLHMKAEKQLEEVNQEVVEMEKKLEKLMKHNTELVRKLNDLSSYGVSPKEMMNLADAFTKFSDVTYEPPNNTFDSPMFPSHIIRADLVLRYNMNLGATRKEPYFKPDDKNAIIFYILSHIARAGANNNAIAFLPRTPCSTPIKAEN